MNEYLERAVAANRKLVGVRLPVGGLQLLYDVLGHFPHDPGTWWQDARARCSAALRYAVERGSNDDVAYIECLDAQEALYWEARQRGWVLDDKAVGDILRLVAPILFSRSDASIMLGLLRRLLDDGYWDFRTRAAMPHMAGINCLVVDGKVYDLSDDEVAALTRFETTLAVRT